MEDGVKDEKFWYYGGPLKNLNIYGTSHKTNIYQEIT